MRTTQIAAMPTVGYVTGHGTARLDELKAQAWALEQVCTRRGWELITVVYDVDHGKGRARARPALRSALQRLVDGEAACLAVDDLGGLCRSVAELSDILATVDRAGARLVSLRPEMDTGTDAGRDAARIVAAVSAWERTRAAERGRRGLAAAREKGALRPVIDPALKRRIERMRAIGMTLQGIADELNEAGVPTVRGGATWRPSGVQAAVGYKRPTRS
jgi:DNA invertase Pin-like site-specific DNA recombinase